MAVGLLQARSLTNKYECVFVRVSSKCYWPKCCSTTKTCASLVAGSIATCAHPQYSSVSHASGLKSVNDKLRLILLTLLCGLVVSADCKKKTDEFIYELVIDPGCWKEERTLEMSSLTSQRMTCTQVLSHDAQLHLSTHLNDKAGPLNGWRRAGKQLDNPRGNIHVGQSVEHESNTPRFANTHRARFTWQCGPLSQCRDEAERLKLDRQERRRM